MTIPREPLRFQARREKCACILCTTYSENNNNNIIIVIDTRYTTSLNRYTILLYYTQIHIIILRIIHARAIVTAKNSPT